MIDISSFSFSIDSKLIAVGFKNCDVKILDASLREIDSQLLEQNISSISFSKDGLKLLITGKKDDVKLWTRSPNGEFTLDNPLSKNLDV